MYREAGQSLATYLHTVDTPKLSSIGTFESDMRAHLIQQVYSSSMVTSMKFGVRHRYLYRDPSGQPFATVVITHADCEAQ
jgi:hypothetical protein